MTRSIRIEEENKQREAELTKEYEEALEKYLGKERYENLKYNMSLSFDDLENGKSKPVGLTYIERINLDAYREKFINNLNSIQGKSVWNVSMYKYESCGE